ncbi:molybdopterin-dependent oxidoreductase [Pseudonocardia sp. C8]|uniref:molybdopterin-dependent oxidoreductase n=1 Tax=Pseudonocardia sp. C8 TaxID=2762759 RepID=UPI001642417E|nr:molybdopterin-dependent oxidoreductase [Pseudonocardia sp. C8]MBC3190938.1 molybdopterin-dependent oxidoreductase [Pseudonocardia sp. C8]
MSAPTADPSSTDGPSWLPRLPAAAGGVLAVAAALGFGHLTAGVVSPASSPFLAVGDVVIRFSPQFLTEFAKATFGVADKPVLLAGMAVVITAVAAVAGLVSRRRPGPGLGVVAVLGMLGLAAVVVAPVFTARDLLAPIVALMVGLVTFAGLHALARRAHPTVTDAGAGGRAEAEAGVGSSRRALLIGCSAAVAVAALGAGLGGLVLAGVAEARQRVTDQLARLRPVTARAPAIPAGAAFPELGTPSFLTPNSQFYRIDVALRVPAQRAQDWSMPIHGMVDNPFTLTFDDLLARPLVERTITMTCVSNPVGGQLISTANFVGVELRELLLEAGVRPGADQIYSTSIDGWYTGTPTEVLLEPGRGALLAIGMNGEALPPEHGFPVRMVVPGLYGYVSATKWIVDMEATTFAAKTGYWLERGWAQQAPIKTQSRIDRPRGFETVPAGRVVVAGIAWSQPTGIDTVEVRMDGGPWQAAELATEVSGHTWRMWRTAFDLAPGSHTVQTRATDGTGVTQTARRADPIPDGASGWPATIFTTS